EDGIRDWSVTGVQTCALPIFPAAALARRSDGSMVAWGDNSNGQCNVPALLPGQTCVGVATGGRHAAALCSDGSVVAWGYNGFGRSEERRVGGEGGWGGWSAGC